MGLLSWIFGAIDGTNGCYVGPGQETDPNAPGYVGQCTPDRSGVLTYTEECGQTSRSRRAVDTQRAHDEREARIAAEMDLIRHRVGVRVEAERRAIEKAAEPEEEPVRVNYWKQGRG
jgi:hypothetical protein